MTKGKRISNILTGILMLACSVIMIALPDIGYALIAFILSVTLLLSGIRSLLYYFTMARYMVGGGSILYRGVILFDLGAFTFTLTEFPKSYIIIYLVVYHAFLGAVDILRTRETLQAGSKHWKLIASRGVVNLAMAAGCITFIWWTNGIVYIYSAGLAYTAVVQIVTAFRRTSMVYIQ